MQLSEQLLIERIKESSYYAFEHLFKEYHPRLFAFARRFIKDDHHAREVVLDVFIRLWERREKLTITKSLNAYLLISTKNHCLNFIRSRRDEIQYYSEADLQLLELELSHYTDNMIIENLTASQLSEEIDKAVSNLPDQRQKIFRLSRFEGRTSKEIAKKLKLSVRTVETHIYLSIKQLRDDLEGLIST